MSLPRNLCRVLANTGEVKDVREKKELNMEIRKSEFAGVETIKKNYIDRPINNNVCRCVLNTFYIAFLCYKHLFDNIFVS